MMFGRHIDFEYDETVLIKSVEDLNMDSEQVLTHSNFLINHSSCLFGIGSFALNTELFYGLLN
jgi:hypothetical protein